jgi:hypothetical protein
MGIQTRRVENKNGQKGHFALGIVQGGWMTYNVDREELQD